MIVPPIIINDEVYHPLIEEIKLFPPTIRITKRYPEVKPVIIKYSKHRNGRRKVPGSVQKNRQKVRKQLWEESSKCFYCKIDLLFKESTLDHKIPISKGGSEKIENFVLACRKCNKEKADIPFEEFVK